MTEIVRRPHWVPGLLNFFVRRKMFRQKIPLTASFKLTVDCRRCGFTPVAEASAALDLHPGSLFAGWRAYLS